MTTLKGTLGFIGGGNMAEAMTGAVIKARITAPENIRVCEIDEKKLEIIADKYGIVPCKSMTELVLSSDYIIIAIKPQTINDALETLVKTPGFPFRTKKLIMSIVAGVTSAQMEKIIYRNIADKDRKNIPIVRIMPNTPSLVLSGMSGYCLNSVADEKDCKNAETILRSMGKTLRVEEDLMNAVTAVSGSGPAYFFFMIEAMVEAGVSLGLSKSQALILSVQTMKGAANLLEQSGEEPESLRKKVTSPGGTTEAALQVFFNSGMKKTIAEALEAAAERACELSG